MGRDDRTRCPPAVTGAALEGAGRHAVVVDDDEDVRQLTALLLERTGFRVTQARSGAEAVGLPDDVTGTVDLLVTDLMMPGLAGDQVADAYLARSPGIAVVLMSGVAEEVPPDSRVVFLAKPFSRRRLADAIAIADRLAGRV